MLGPPEHAVILAAGRGRRLRPHTDHTPKPLLPVRGRPLLAYTLDALQTAGVRRVCLVTHYLAEQIENYVGDGAAWGLHTTFCRQEQMLGTAHALQAAQAFLTAPTFVLAADYILPPHYLADLKAVYQHAGKPLAVSLKEIPATETTKRSQVQFNETAEIIAIQEKPPRPAGAKAVAASLIYIVPPDIKPYLSRLSLSPRREYELRPSLIKGYVMATPSPAGCSPPQPSGSQAPRAQESPHTP